MSKPARLDPDILAQKPSVAATAAPTGTLKPQQIAAADLELEPELVEPAHQVIEGPERSLSVKVDASRYHRVGLAKLNKSKTTQEILSEGLDLWLKKHKC